MPLNTAAKNVLLDGSAIDEIVVYLSLHDDDPTPVEEPQLPEGTTVTTTSGGRVTGTTTV